MVRQGAEVAVLTARAAGETHHRDTETQRGDGVGARHVVPLRDGVRVYPWLERWGWRATLGAVERATLDFAPDVLNIQYQTAAYAMHPAINLLPWLRRDLAIVPTFHDLLVPYLFPKAGALRWGANLALARGARGVIVTNAQDEERLARYPWLLKLARIPIGSNIAAKVPPAFDRAAARARWGIPPESLLLCYFGFLNASKGGEELIEALASLCQGGEDARLLMIGGAVGASDPTNCAYLEVVREAVRARGLDERVVWTGHVEEAEVSAAFASADLCVLPYRDGASFRRGSFMAALAHGMAIVTTQPQVRVPELVEGENVLLVPPRDAVTLAAAIRRLAHDVALCARLRVGARALSAQFDWPRIAARTLEVYRDAAQRR
jgi:polysaccharide biosynthesis protein PslF